ncbi:hypothetical protein EG328_004645 [Venturia inaequalis]|uniref:Heterokaryon incompatibility domain-containing protein n=1 Tax=Venturia inaequalis TaxID=5025 RepID=A0A8H3VHB4_VENIN|nr:hypothetical protein EG328_004645 [Venturia inaequalis]KAE9988441.1 hypothetical protein EG327_003369 [Venturia inaequalis]
MTSSTFKYSPLPEPDGFRIILLQPSASRDTSLQCKLLHTTLSQCDRDIIDHYTALSYVWGNAAQRGSILIDGTFMDITATLESALRDIRDASRIVRIWADAVCINQNDNDEKAVQIGLFARIYGTAQHTVIYLGPSMAEGDIVLSIAPSNTTGTVSSEYSWLECETAGDQILKLSWFSRVWVFQELVLSDDPWVQLGNLRARWADVCSILLNENAASLQGESATRRQVLKDMNSTRGTKSNTLFNLLLSRRGLGATDSRDMIFAHMSTASDIEEVKKYVQINYDKSCVILYENVARYLLDHVEPYGPEIFFRHIEDMEPDSRRKGLASWAPDWSLRGPGLEPMFRDNLANGHRGLTAKDHYVWVGDPWILASIGYEADVVKEVSLVFPNPAELLPRDRRVYQSTVDRLRQFYREQGGVWWSGDKKGRHRHISLKGREANHEQLALKLAKEWIKIMTNDLPNLSPESTEINDHKRFLALFESWLRRRATQGLIMVGSDSDGIENIMFAYLLPNPISSILTGRKLFFTQSGRIGVAPKSTQRGDRVIYLTGKPPVTAMIIRQTESRKTASLELEIREAFLKKKNELHIEGRKDFISADGMAIQRGILIGDCYVDGVVGWLQQPEEEPLMKIFALR